MGFLSGVAQAFEQVAPSPFGIRDGKLLFNPSAHLLGALEKVLVKFVLELGELFFAEKAVGAARFQTTECLQPAAVIASEPVGNGIGNNPKYLSDFGVGVSAVFEKQTQEAFAKPYILFVFVAMSDFRSMRVGKGKAKVFHTFILPENKILMRR